MKLLLQNNPVYLKPINPITGLEVPDWMGYVDELTLATKISGKSRFIEGLIFDDIKKGINKEWERIMNQSDDKS